MELRVKEKFVLLCLDPDKGMFINASTGFNYGMIGAVLTDLLLEGKIRLKNGRIHLPVARPDPDWICHDVLRRIRKSRRQQKLKTWIMNLGMQGNRYAKRVLDQLVVTGFVKRNRKMFLIFSYFRYPVLKRDLLGGIQQDLKSVLAGKHEPTETDIALLSLLDASQGLKALFPDRKERKEARIRIKELKGRSPHANEMTEAIHHAAAAVAALSATTAASV